MHPNRIKCAWIQTDKVEKYISYAIYQELYDVSIFLPQKSSCNSTHAIDIKMMHANWKRWKDPGSIGALRPKSILSILMFSFFFHITPYFYDDEQDTCGPNLIV